MPKLPDRLAKSADRLRTWRKSATTWINASHLRQWLAFLVLAGFCELVIVGMLNAIGADNFDWGNVPTWIGANLTTATLSLALVISIGDRRDREDDKQFEADERNDRAKRQARLIDVKVANTRVFITNHSDAPILRVRARVIGDNRMDEIAKTVLGTIGKDAGPDITVLKPDATEVLSDLGVPEDREIKAFKNRTAIERAVFANTPGYSAPRVELRFVDADGRKWVSRYEVTGTGDPVIRQDVGREARPAS
ncbi:hypothetical protein TPB0596_12270 [Tsukamurella pulmonis]|uniref:hypothetical protein n=1 Tax=Tsukamurella pulmonis TaxID=47312 RepID=UPI001EDD22FB|nr:hypothetical protein [Tsukamurella pulmonis]BDD81464.1 hypothetical protein TPB0596_12270 [Tsukamurella pulmonis]